MICKVDIFVSLHLHHHVNLFSAAYLSALRATENWVSNYWYVATYLVNKVNFELYFQFQRDEKVLKYTLLVFVSVAVVDNSYVT